MKTCVPSQTSDDEGEYCQLAAQFNVVKNDVETSVEEVGYFQESLFLGG